MSNALYVIAAVVVVVVVYGGYRLGKELLVNKYGKRTTKPGEVGEGKTPP